MSRTDRRSMLQLAMAAAIAPAAFTPARASTPDQLIAPPSGQMRYCRTIVRDLADGTNITVNRQFLVEFRRFGGGFMLHGAQDSVSVDAPPALAQFSELEMARDESVLFPLALDPFGQILSSDNVSRTGNDVGYAVDRALAQIARQPIAEEEREQLAAFVMALQQASQRVTAHLPADLFAPEASPRREERRIALPGGGEGMVASQFGGVRDRDTGLMSTAEREVLTVVASSSKRQRERWTLAAV